MATKSEELIEKAVTTAKAKPTLKVSRKSKNSESTEEVKNKKSTAKATNVSTSTTDEKNIKKEKRTISRKSNSKNKANEFSETNVAKKTTNKEKATKTSKKESTSSSKAKKEVKAPKAKTSTEKTVTQKVDEPTLPVSKRGIIKSSKTVTSQVEQQILKPKRTLRLNLGKKDDSKQNTVKEVTINQNASFFYEPSIFEKFSIDVTSSDESDEIENTENDEIINSEAESQNVKEINEEPVIEINENEQTLSDDVSNEEQTEQPENDNTVLIENDIENKNEETEEIKDEEINIEDLISAEDINAEDLINNIDDTTIIESNNLEEIIAEDFDKKDEASNEIIINNSEDETLKEAASNIDILNSAKEEKTENKNSNPVGKFFDSSIPSMNANNNESYFSKIKNSLFSNMSNVFKKFSYEEAELINNANQENEIPVQADTPASDIQKALGNFAQEAKPLNELEVKAEPATLTIPTIEKDATILSPTSDLSQDSSIADVNGYCNIITPESNTSHSNVDDIDDELLNESILEKSENENTTLDENQIENLDEATISELDLYDNLTDEELEQLLDSNEEVIENNEEIIENEDLTSETSIENKLEENAELLEDSNEANDSEDDFDLEAYFGIKDLKPTKTEELDEEEIIEDEEISDEDIEEPTEVDEFDPEEFEKSFLGELSTSENNEENIENSEVNKNNEVSVVENKAENSEEVNSENTEMSSFSKLLESFNKTISTLSDRIASLEINNSNKSQGQEITEDVKQINEVEEIVNVNEENNEDIKDNGDIEESENIDLNDITINDLDVNDIDITDLENVENVQENNDDTASLSSDINIEDLTDDITLEDLGVTEENLSEEINSEDAGQNNESIEDILSKVFSDENSNIDEEMKKELLSEVLSFENSNTDTIDTVDNTENEESLIPQENDENSEVNENNETPVVENKDQDPTTDFFKIIDSLTKTISELENTPNEKSEVVNNNTQLVLPAEVTGEDKAINILINKDDIFSISILNETYEIVADFDGISVLSENIHISTPKNNFFVKIGEKYIEIHNQKDHFSVNTNFEDIEFANAINNVTFAKKNNKIELNIKEAFKLSSVNNKIELSILNTNIVDMSNTSSDSENSNESSICDNRTLLISEETQKVYLPYTIKEVMQKLNNSSEYQTVEEVVENEYTLPLSTFKMPIISRFKEAYRFMRVKEKSSVYAALDLALELMFNSNLNPAVIRASKDLKELNIYLDCLYENEIDKFDCFKIIYKVLPKIQ